jgi:uncharacterized protein (TIGR01777 family)
VEPTRTLAAAAASLPQPPPVWVQMSTLAIYGDAGDAVLDERSPVADGPPQMAGVARAWEAAAREAVADRVAVLRTGIVLARGTPALDRLTHLTRLGLGGRIASGKQWVSWLHERDYLDIVHRVITDDALAGTIHVTSPNPVRNVELMRALRHALRRPPSPPTPAPFVRIGARLMGTDPALALTGRRCVPGVLLEHGYEFEYPDLDRALDELLARESSNES